MPASLETRGIILVLLVAVSIGLPVFLGYRLVNQEQQARHAASAEALLAVALSAYLDSVADGSTTYDEWMLQLAEQESRVRWAGIFDDEGEGLEFCRRTDLRREDIVAQLPTASTGPQLMPLVVRGQPSTRFALVTVPQADSGATLAAVVDLGAERQSGVGLMIAGLVCCGVIGLAAALGWFHLAVQRPIQNLGRWSDTLHEGLTEAALDHAAPEELRELAKSVEQTQRQLRKWQSEAGHLRYSLDMRVDAKTRQVTRELQRAEHAADTDALTKLRNRRTLERELPRLFDEQRAAGGELTAVWFDVDHFKTLNDTLGHQAGDEILAFLGELIRATVRKSTDLAIRYGGDEFVLILPGTSATEAADVALRLRNLFLQRVRLLDGVDPRPGISAGVAAMHHDHVHSPEELLEMADAAMYHAKQKRSGVATVREVRAAAG